MVQTFKHAIITCHPDERSFTLSMARRYAEVVQAQGHETVLRDLYRITFDPVLKSEERLGDPAADVQQEWAILGKPDVFVLVYPIWFGAPPAMLKGYIDRVFGAGRTRGRGRAGDTGELLAGRRLVSLTSSGSERSWLNQRGVLSSLHTVYDRYFAEVFGFLETHRHHVDGMDADIAPAEMESHLSDVEQAARAVVKRMEGGPPERHPHKR